MQRYNYFCEFTSFWGYFLECRVNKQVQNYKKCLKNSTLGEEKFNFSLGRLLILA